MSQTTQPTTEQITKIRDLNDALRTARDHAGTLTLNGSLVVTRGLVDRGPDFMTCAIQAMRTFNDFDADNDPWGEHDCGVMHIDDVAVIWKIDYYAPDLQHASEAPWDAGVTRRILTLMLAEEY